MQHLSTADITQESLSKALPQAFTLSREADYLAVGTPFSYPDGQLIEVTIQDGGNGAVVADLGQTLQRMRDFGADLNDPWTEELFEEIRRAFKLRLQGGMLKREAASLSEVALAVYDLCAAILVLTFHVKRTKGTG